jgi:tetratricopeptide (TPR) repeat protein
VARGCSFLIETPQGQAGVGYATTWLEVRGKDGVLLTVTSDEPWRALVDGEVVWREEDETELPRRTRRVHLPLDRGWHRLSIKVAAPGARTELIVSMEAAPALAFREAPPPGVGRRAGRPGRSGRVMGRAVPSSASSLLAMIKGNGVDARIAEFLAANAAARDGAPGEAEEVMERLLERAPRFVSGWLLGAQLASEDTLRPARFVRDRTRQMLERALSIDAGAARARYHLATMELDEERPDKALEQIGDLDGWRPALLRYQAYRDRGWQHEAEEALRAARRANPEACTPIETEVALAREHHDVMTAGRLAAELVRCIPTATEVADVARERGDARMVVAEYRRLLAIDGTRERWRASLAEALLRAGEAREAAEVLRRLVMDYPRTADYRRQLAEAHVALGERMKAEEVLRTGLGEMPEAEELHRALAALGQGNLLDPYRVDGQAIIAEFARAGRRYETPAVIVLDRTVMRVFATGARLVLTHNIVRVQTKEGIDKWGEVTLPQDADVLTLRTVKADGTTREPEEIAGKQSISVPDLEPGDYVEFEYVDRMPPLGAFPGGFLSERFYFQSFDAPLDRTEYVVVVPEGFSVGGAVGRGPRLLVDRRGAAPEAVVTRGGVAPADKKGSQEAVQVITWSGRSEPQLVPEPQQAPFTEYVPSVRVAAGVSFEQWRDFVRDQSFGALRANAELRALARRLTAGKGAAGKVQALDDWVRHNIKEGGSITEPAIAVLARGEGSRVSLLRALLQAAGIHSSVWLVRPQTSAVLEGALPDLEGYDEAVLAVDTGEAGGGRQPMLLDPRYRHMPTALVSPLLRGQRALVLEAGERARFALVPAGRDVRRIALSAELEASGDGKVEVREHLEGWPAVEYREALDQIAPDRLRPEFEQRLVGFFFPGATLEDLEVSKHEDDGRGLEVRYRFHAPALARAEGRRLVLGAPFPAMLGRAYVQVARRTTPLEVLYAPPTEVTAHIRLPAGAQATAVAAVEEGGFGEFVQKVTAGAGEVALESRFVMQPMRIAPERYAEFTRFAEGVDAAESRIAEITLP